ncbi:KR domain-containing protein [Nemania diffusa]|nr:KR domain-containing protein [Nemania diffusa]
MAGKLLDNISPTKAFPIVDVGRALRTMQTSEHIGKLVLVSGKTDMVNAILLPEAIYVIVGGLTGIGASVAKLLLNRKAKKFLASYQEYCHGGMVLQDSILEQMAWTQRRDAVNPKLLKTKNINELFGESLDFYVMLSSGASMLSNPSQANYAVGDAYQDAIARYRASGDWAAVTIDLGMVQSVEFVAETAGVEERLLKTGHLPISEAEVIALVEHGIRKPRRSVHRCQVASGLRGINSDPRSAFLRKTEGQAGKGGASGRATRWGGEASLSEQIAQAKTADEAADAVQQAIVTKVPDMFVLQESDINPSHPLSEYGVDSLVAVELRNWLVPNAHIEMSISDLLGSPSLTELAKSVV